MEEEPKRVSRDRPEPEQGRGALVTDWLKKIKEGRDFWEPSFEKMKKSAAFVAGKQWSSDPQDDRYQANLTLRHINQRVASLYAKNPRVRVTPKKRMYNKVWDGTTEMLQMAMSGAMSPGVAMEVIAEAQRSTQERALRNRIAETAELVAQYSLDEPIPPFKLQAKGLVRRVLTCSIGYLKVGYQRKMEPSPDTETKIADMGERLAKMQQVADDLADMKIEADSKEAAELQLQIADLQQQESVLVREGIVFNFPKAWSIIVDPACTQLKGFVGAGWVAQEYIMDPKRVQQLFGVDLGENFTAFTSSGAVADKRFRKNTFARWYEVYDLQSQMTFSVCEGYPDFLNEPGKPEVQHEQFHPYFVLSFNDVESCEDELICPSNAELVRPMAKEYNRQREGLRQHRIANRPGYIGRKGVLKEEEKEKFGTHLDHEVIEVELPSSMNLAEIVTPKPTIAIEPSLYDTEPVFTDIMRTVGDSEAHMGGTAGASATENSIAETSRATSIQSNIDDLDDFLTQAMRAVVQILLTEMSEETVLEIAGPGAAWPSLDREQIVKELIADVKAGSSGRPNKGARTQAVERVLPLLLQVPGIKPRKLAEFLLTELDEAIDIEEFLDDALPSIVTMNAMSKPNLAAGPGNEAQAAAGETNAAAPEQSPGKMQNMDPQVVDGPQVFQ